MRKILALVVALCTLVTITAACGKPDTPSDLSTPEVSTDKTVNLNIPGANGDASTSTTTGDVSADTTTGDASADATTTGSAGKGTTTTTGGAGKGTTTTTTAKQTTTTTLPNVTVKEPDTSIDLTNHDFGGVTIKRILWYTVGKDEQKMLSEFQQKYNVKVQDVVVDYENINDKLAASMTSGDVIDAGFLYGAFFPTQVIANMYMPVDSYIKRNYLVDTSSVASIANGGFDMQKMDYFKWKGRYYGLASYWDVDMMVLYYNKRKFQEADIKTPLEHVEDGTWNMDTFYDIALELTDADAGMYGWSAGGENAGGGMGTFVSAFGTQYVKYDSNGNPQQNLGDSRVMQSLQFLQKMYYGAGLVVGGETATFYNGTAAMCTDGLYMIPKLMNNSKVPDSVKKNWEIAPIPMAKGHENDPYPSDWLKSIGILRGSKNPDAVAAYAYYRSKYKMDNLYEEFMTEEQKNRVTPYYKNLNYSNHAYGDLGTKIGELVSLVTTGSDIAQLISENKSVFQAQIDRVIKG